MVQSAILPSSSMSVDPEPLVSYRIPSYSINNRLNMNLISDPYNLQHPSDQPPLVRSKHAPPALSKMRISISAELLRSMSDIEIAPSHQQLRGKSVAITSHMAPGWIGASARARFQRKEIRKKKKSRSNPPKKDKGGGSLFLEYHCNMSNQQLPGKQPHMSHSAKVSQFKKLKNPEILLPTKKSSSETSSDSSGPVTFVDDIKGNPGAWGNARHKSFDAFQDKTKLLIQRSHGMHESVLNRVAVF